MDFTQSPRIEKNYELDICLRFRYSVIQYFVCSIIYIRCLATSMSCVQYFAVYFAIDFCPRYFVFRYFPFSIFFILAFWLLYFFAFDVSPFEMMRYDFFRVFCVRYLATFYLTRARLAIVRCQQNVTIFCQGVSLWWSGWCRHFGDDFFVRLWCIVKNELRCKKIVFSPS